MIVIKMFEDYIKSVNKKEKTLGKDVLNVINKYSEYAKDIVNTLADYKDDSDSDDILEIILDNFKKSIEVLYDALSNLDSKEKVLNLFVEYKNSLLFLSDDITKELSKDAEKIGISKSLLSLYAQYNDIVSNLKNKEDIETVDDAREEIKKLFDNIISEINSKLANFNIEDVLKTANLERDGTASEMMYNSGDNIRYKKTNGDINTASVSNNQENLKDSNNIRLLGKGGEQFEIDKSSIIEIVKRTTDITASIKNDIKEISSDPSKLKKLSDFLDELKNV